MFPFPNTFLLTSVMDRDSLIEEYKARKEILVKRRNELLSKKRKNLESNKITKKSNKKLKNHNNLSTVVVAAHTIDTYKEATSLISKYSKLPELDMDLRLRYAQMTCPWMSVSNIDKSEKLNKSSFITTLNFDTFNDFTISITIDTLKQCIDNLKITSIQPLVLQERYSIKSLILKSEKYLDVTMFVYGINTFLRMRHKRKRVWMSLIDDIQLDSIRSINSFNVSDVQSREKLNILLFKDSPSFIEFQLKSRKLRIDWSISFEKKRHCVSNFSAMVYEEEGKVRDISKLFKDLIKSKDVKLAILQILQIL